MFAFGPGDEVTDLDVVVEYVIAEERRSHFLVSPGIFPCHEIAVTRKPDAGKANILGRVCRNAQGAGVEGNTRVVIRNVHASHADVYVIQERSAESVIVLDASVVRF